MTGSATGKTGSNSCNDCHDIFATVHAVTDHSFRVALAPDCSDCHTGTEGSVTGIYLNQLDNKAHDACLGCHGTTGQLVGSATGKEGATAGTPNNCSTCHGVFSENHASSIDHLATVVMHNDCSGCHTTVGNFVDPVSPRTHDACTTCHDVNGRLISLAIGHNGGGDCTLCHGNYLPNHQAPNHDYRSIYFGSGPDCTACHTNDTSVLGSAGTGTLLSQSDVNTLHRPPTGDECSLCHYYDEASQSNTQGLPLSSTVSNAILDGVNGVADATCIVCHDYNLTGGHGVTDHTSNGTVTGTANCLSCHDATGTLDYVRDIHLNVCGKCHLDGVGGDTLIGSATGHEGASVGNPNTCITCHTTFISLMSAGHINKWIHTDEVKSNPGCITSGCHDMFSTTEAITNNTPHGCTVCHNFGTIELKGSAANKGIGKVIPGGGIDCVTCHSGTLTTPTHDGVTP